MKPVILSKYGDTLSEYPYSQVEDTFPLDSFLGIHSCRGWVDVIPISEGYYALRCRKCAMRLGVPSSVQTVGGLRGYLQEHQV